MTTKHYTIEPHGFGRSKFGQPSTGTNIESDEFKTRGFGDPRTKQTTDNKDGSNSGTPTYTGETIPITSYTAGNND